MKDIRLLKLHLVNFKAARDRTIVFDGRDTDIAGRNASGKTTIFDAFTWLLFGKDSQGRKAFELKTLGADGKAIPRLPHEVEAELTVSDQPVHLARRLTEQWIKKRGTAEAEFKGHEETRLWDGVPCSVKEWGDKIAALCDEQAFKLITSPTAFCTMKPDAQRAMLFRIAGETADEDIAATREDFTRMLSALNGKTIEEARRAVAAEKKRLKAALDEFPARMDERQREIANLQDDFTKAEQDLKDFRAELSEVEAKLADRTRWDSQRADYIAKATRDRADYAAKIAQREADIEAEATAALRKAQREQQAISDEQDELRAVIKRLTAALAYDRKTAEAATARRDKLVADWKRIKAEQPAGDTAEPVCPTCGRPFPPEQAERMRAEALAAFNADKAARLAAINAEGAEARRKMDEANASIQAAEGKIRGKEQEIARLEATRKAPGPKPDTTKAKADDAETKRLREQYDALADVIQRHREAIGADKTETLQSQKAVLQEAIRATESVLRKRDDIRRNEERLHDLQQQMSATAQQLADCEREEQVMQDFRRAKTAAMEAKINALFRFVRFRLYTQQINGGEAETCEATVGGVPYASLNRAAQINAGLDIINAICRAEQVQAPIFIDNAEAVLQPERTDSQQICLYVDEADLTAGGEKI